MNVFVLSTGRCGSTTFAKACAHIANYTSSHESLSQRSRTNALVPYKSLIYPENHIEVDNRLSWFLGRLEETYGDSAYYVHLIRDPGETARSFANRWDSPHTNIIFSFVWGVLKHAFDDVRNMPERARLEIAEHYCHTVNENIRQFLRNKSCQTTMWLHDIDAPFRDFWSEIGAEGDLQAALSEWQVTYNASAPKPAVAPQPIAAPEPPQCADPETAIAAALSRAPAEDLSWLEGRVRTMGWTLAPDALRMLACLVRNLKPRRILEFGSGLSTQVLARTCAETNRPCAITTLDHDPDFSLRVCDLPAEEACRVRLVHAPVVAREINGAPLPVYHLDPSDPATQQPADLIFIDGPPTVLGGREGALYQALDFARPGTIILLDDAARPEEQAALRRWSEALGPAVHLQMLPGFERGLAAVIVRDPVRSNDVWQHQFRLVADDIETLVPSDGAVILVDHDMWPFGSEISGRKRIPFIEKNGAYWGPPENSATGIRELERLRHSGANVIIFTPPALWWLDHYVEFNDHLRTSYRCIKENRRMIAFELQP